MLRACVFRAVEVVVELLEEGDEALVVNGFGLGIEWGAGAEEVEDVVKAVLTLSGPAGSGCGTWRT